MSQTIYKYPISPTLNVTIDLPVGAEILTVQTIDNSPYIWALVDPNAEIETRFFEVFATGEEILSDMGTTRRYIGTFQIQYAITLMFHLFENTGL